MTFIASTAIVLPQNLDRTKIYTVSGLTATAELINSLTALSISAVNLVADSLTYSNTSTVFVATYDDPVNFGGKRIWFDDDNNVLRVKNSAPSSKTDGYILTEGTNP